MTDKYKIKFLGTAGARFVMLNQMRASGGVWISRGKTNMIIDPGPGSLVRCIKSRPKLDPSGLDGIILTHRHLDHSGDVNVMIEAMTGGGFKKRGIVFAPDDALNDDPVILRYNRAFPEKIEFLKEGGKYQCGEITFTTPLKHIHGTETYGLIFLKDGKKHVSFITDTKYFDKLEKVYDSEYIIISVVRFIPKEGLDHLDINDVEKIIKNTSAKKYILTHFGMTMIKAKPHIVAENLSQKLKKEVIAASDGMTIEF
ncbi:MAG: MBL fold metallo-hydrolase [Candidatus Omnitrophota bacterium]